MGEGAGRDETDRRGFLKRVGSTTAAGGLATALAEREIAGAVRASTVTDRSVFAVDAEADPAATYPQSIASGGPTPSGVILWTRVAPAAHVADEPLGVQVATDESFENVVYEGTVAPDRLDPVHDYTVRVDLDGELAADTRYHYRFVYDGTASRTGRCRTLPAPDASPDEVSVAVLTCQDYQNGYYGAYHHVAEEDVDFVVHLGDFIYESADGQWVQSLRGIREGRELSLPSGADLAETLADFRYLYRQYRGDSLLQEGLRNHTVIHGWDDHEIGNDRYWDSAAGAPVLPDKERGDDPEFATTVTADGIQAWIEYVPARVAYDPSASHIHEQLQLWRDLQFGDLVDLSVTDERLYRDGPPCDGERLTFCDEEEAPDRTMLGSEQKSYFEEWIRGSEAVWTVWANEVMTMPLTVGEDWYSLELVLDSWDGYQYERWELLQLLSAADPRNFVTLTGDLHASMAGYLMDGYGQIDWQWGYDRVGVEFMTPSVTSRKLVYSTDLPSAVDDELVASLVESQNDHLEFVNWQQHGYAVVEFTREDATCTIYAVDKEVDAADAEREVLATYRTPDGETELEEL
ncbi:alkaline phosphatase D family protein [Halorientalis halophila]|uniref:alkaline phosphatase D family protein n=1 Tax=Halorientalis halophila TaxID=3108499 RepID=UPI003008BC0B